MLTTRWKALGLAAVLLVACDSEGGGGATTPPLAEGPAPTPQVKDVRPGNLDHWVGKWNGPEGTYLSISKQRDRFTLEIADLDGPKTYTALNVGDHFEFQRNGRVERLRATNGKQTGMKWLQDKSDCLTIKPGEGYCRD